jgi:hypothetical protein
VASGKTIGSTSRASNSSAAASTPGHNRIGLREVGSLD